MLTLSSKGVFFPMPQDDQKIQLFENVPVTKTVMAVIFLPRLFRKLEKQFAQRSAE